MLRWIDRTRFSDSDLDDLLSNQEPETDVLEFKRDLSNRDGGPSPWMQGQRNIDTRPNDRLLREVVAFANTDGGWLVLGIEETENSPARAYAVNSLPDIHDLADRLRQVMDAKIEPPLTGLKVFLVEYGAAGHGAIIFRVPRSELMPHRTLTNKSIYMRRMMSAEEIGMREASDLAVATYRH
jgi:hypothetical protein